LPTTTTQRLRRTDLPLLLIQGALDKEINATPDSTLAVVRETPHASVVSLAEAGHFANMEQAAAFNQILETFLAGANYDR